MRKLQHPSIDEFLDYLWEFPLVFSEGRFVEWERSRTGLVEVALGEEWPSEFRQFLVSSGESPGTFRTLVESVVEIVFSSFFGKSDDLGSMDFLRSVLFITERHGVEPPPLGLFSHSLFVDESGFGKPLTAEQRDAWRTATPA